MTEAPHPGQVLEIAFPTFRSRVTFQSERELTVRIVDGENAGVSDSVEYETMANRDGIVALSWREHIGGTIVHVLDLTLNQTYTFVTPAIGGFIRLSGRIEVKSRT